ncbi:MAG TPA: ABC-F family ATP-binding cassette domain-containing protein [Pseudogracilibacillus sp.]|nr:ABC-F family ATP-binding cassette domain-containing protein [Pseudogracilibacillus sp.]
MIMQLNNIVKSFAGNTILENINIEVKKNDRIAFVGRNGAGKSTLLRIIVDEIDYDAGELMKNRDVTIGYLAQHHDLDSERTIIDEMHTVFNHLIAEEKALLEMAEQISAQSNHPDSNTEKLINEYSKRSEQFAADGGYRFRSDIKGVLNGLGFSEADFKTNVHMLSGGQKTRLALGKLLLENPNLLVLDEPTNHLDIATLSWLENYLSNYDGAIIIVSHDRYFLDKTVTKIYDIAHKRATLYHGSYSEFLRQKAERMEREWKQYEKQQTEIKQAEDFIARNIARASTSKRAQSRRKQLEKTELIDRPLEHAKKADFSFDIAIMSGRDVLATENYSYQYPGMDEPLFENVSFSIQRGERIALIGHNGAGKTTLLRAIIKDKENFTHGANLQIGYYSQEQEDLNEANTILEEVWGSFPNKTELEIRTVLGNFLFTGDDVLKQIHLLSGGEKARVSLAKLMLQEANLLILDEPTNHLDLESKEVLESALQYYPGTILFVSHDRYFINKNTDRIFELTKEGIEVFLGNYDYYMERKELEAARKKLAEQEEALIEVDEPTSDAALSFAEQKRLQSEARTRRRKIEQIEKKIDEKESKLAETELAMTDPDIFNDHEKLNELSKAAEGLKAEIDTLFEQWTDLQE